MGEGCLCRTGQGAVSQLAVADCVCVLPSSFFALLLLPPPPPPLLLATAWCSCFSLSPTHTPQGQHVQQLLYGCEGQEGQLKEQPSYSLIHTGSSS